MWLGDALVGADVSALTCWLTCAQAAVRKVALSLVSAFVLRCASPPLCLPAVHLCVCAEQALVPGAWQQPVCVSPSQSDGVSGLTLICSGFVAMRVQSA